MLAASIPIPAQKNIVHNKWSEKDGLIPSDITSIISDHDGFIWFTTSRGLGKFDGSKFYYYNQSSTANILTDSFTSLLEWNNKIVAGTESFGLYIVDGLAVNNIWIGNSSKKNTVNKLVHLNQNEILIATLSGVYKYDLRDQKLLDSAFVDLPINDLIVHNEDSIFVSLYSKGIYQLDNKLEVQDSVTNEFAEFASNIAFYNNYLWSATSTGLYKISKTNNVTKVLSDQITNLKLCKQNLIVITTDNLLLITGNNVSKLDVPIYFENQKVASVMRDEKGRLWLGTDKKLHLIYRSSLQIFDDNHGLSNSDVVSIFEDSDKNVLIGTNGGGLYKYNSQTSELQKVKTDLDEIWAIYEDKSGRIFLASTGKISVMENNREKIYTYANNPQSRITLIKESREEGNLLLTNSIGEILRFDGEQIFNPIMGRMVYGSIYSATNINDTVWVASDIALYKQYESSLKVFDVDDGLRSSSFRAIYKTDNYLWLGTKGGGLIKYKSGKFTSYSIKEGLPCLDIFSILEDERSNLWFSCTDELFTIPKNEFNKFDNSLTNELPATQFGVEVGFPSEELNPGANNSLMDSFGNLWYATKGGAVKFNPDSLLNIYHNVIVEINHININGKKVRETENIQIMSDENNVEIDFSSLYFGNSSNISFRYRLGESSNWIDLGNRKTIFLSNLAVGKYDFVIQASIGSNNWGYSSEIIFFKVLPQFYQTLLFKFVITILTLSLIIFLVRSRIKAYRERNETLKNEINSRKKIESDLRKNELLVNSLLNNSYQVQALLQLNGNVKVINNAALKLISKSMDQVIGKPFWDIFWGTNSQRLRDKSKEWIYLAGRKKTIRKKVTLLNDDNKNEYIDFIMKPVFNSQGQPVYIVVEGHFITDLLEKESALIRSEKKYRNLIEKASDGIVIITKGKIRYANSSILKMLGYSKDEMVSEPFSKFIHPDERAKVEENYKKRIIGQQVPAVYESLLYHKSEQPVYVEINSGVVEFEEDPQTVLAFIRDISDRVAAKEELEDALMYIQTVLNAISTSIISIDENYRVTQYNKSALTFSTNGRNGETIFDIFDKLSFVDGLLKEAMEAKTNKSRIFEIGDDDEEISKFSVNIFPLENKIKPGNVILIEDVTQSKKIEELMIHSEKMMSIAGLAAGMAHEINNPLGTIVQGCQNILRRTSDVLPKNNEIAQKLGLSIEMIESYLKERQVDEIIESMRSAAGKATGIIHNMLQFSRRSESKKVMYDMLKLLDDALELAYNDYDMKKKFDFRSIKVIKDFPESLPRIKVTVTEIEQVIFNILQNAAQALHMAENPTENPTIFFKVYEEASYIVIEIEDNGPGIDPEIQKRIFEPFFTTKDIGEGTGLGLSVSYMIIKNNHDGILSVRSDAASGTTFIIKLPK